MYVRAEWPLISKGTMDKLNTFSFIRTLTVGLGFAPNLLVLRPLYDVGALADFYRFDNHRQ